MKGALVRALVTSDDAARPLSNTDCGWSCQLATQLRGHCRWPGRGPDVADGPAGSQRPVINWSNHGWVVHANQGQAHGRVVLSKNYTALPVTAKERRKLITVCKAKSARN